MSVRLGRHLLVAILAAGVGFVVFGALTRAAVSGAAPTRTIGGGATVASIDPARFASVVAARGGRPVVVNFWASWCGPCSEEASVLAAADRRFAGRVRFVGIAVRDSSGGVATFTRRFGIRYPVFLDPSGSVATDAGVMGVPVTRLYGPHGAVMRQWVGPVHLDQLEAALSR